MKESVKFFRKPSAKILPLFFFAALLPCIASAQVVHGSGAVSALPPLREATGILRAEKGILLEINSENVGSSSDGIRALGEGDADIAMSTHYLSGDEKATYPGVTFKETYIGEQVVVLAVSQDVWEGGVHELTRKQAQGIYDGRITNWKEVGGPDLKITGYTSAPGYGVWETYVVWLYQDGEWIRANRSALVNSNEEAKACLETTPGSITQLAFPWVDGKKVFQLTVKDDKGNASQATIESIVSRTYPMSRPLLILTDKSPVGNIKTVVDFMLTSRGQEFVRKYGYLTLQDLAAKK